MKIVEIMMGILCVCVSILAIIGTMVVLILCAKAFYENFLEFLKCQRARRKADKLDNFHLMTLDDAIDQCQNKKNNSFCDYDERESYKHLQIWLNELKQFREVQRRDGSALR